MASQVYGHWDLLVQMPPRKRRRAAAAAAGFSWVDHCVPNQWCMSFGHASIDMNIQIIIDVDSNFAMNSNKGIIRHPYKTTLFKLSVSFSQFKILCLFYECHSVRPPPHRYLRRLAQFRHGGIETNLPQHGRSGAIWSSASERTQSSYALLPQKE
jgi:hypothetical protein